MEVCDTDTASGTEIHNRETNTEETKKLEMKTKLEDSTNDEKNQENKKSIKRKGDANEEESAKKNKISESIHSGSDASENEDNSEMSENFGESIKNTEKFEPKDEVPGDEQKNNELEHETIDSHNTENNVQQVIFSHLNLIALFLFSLYPDVNVILSDVVIV